MKDFNPSPAPLDFLRGTSLFFDPATGLSPDYPATKRRLSQLRGMFRDEEALEALIAREDSVIYEFHTLPLPETPGDFAFGCSILNPGKVGDEYFFTKGHFHEIADTGEVYYTLAGQGYMMLESADGDWRALAMEPGRAVYVPKGYAHRTVNVSPTEKLISFFAYRADSGHNYGAIEKMGFRHLLVERGGEPAVIDNPNWKEG